MIKYDPAIKLDTIATNYIIEAVKHHGSKAKAAVALGVSRKTVDNYYKRHAIAEKYAPKKEQGQK